MALVMVGATLKQFQAFRPEPSSKLWRSLEQTLPNVILNFQRKMLKAGIKCISDAKTEKQCNVLIVEMARVIADVARHKNVKNPMLGSKIFTFLFPEFFPIWDTAWVKNKAMKYYKNVKIADEVEVSLNMMKPSKPALIYAKYLKVMLDDLRQTPPSELNNLKTACVRYCGKKGYYESRVVFDDNYYDLSALFFEMCLLGKHC